MDKQLKTKTLKLFLIGIALWFSGFAAAFCVTLLIHLITGYFLSWVFGANLLFGFLADAGFLWKARARLIEGYPNWDRASLIEDPLLIAVFFNLVGSIMSLFILFS